MVSETVYQATHVSETVTSVLAANPELSVSEAAKKLVADHLSSTRSSVLGHTSDADPSKEDLDKAAECGNFGRRPSELFLKIYHEVLKTLDEDPLIGVVSPSLLGSRGVAPLSVLSVIADIMQHYYDCIVTAKHEVFLATNYWQMSKASVKICDALKELSRRAQERGGPKVVVKMMYDRGSPKQLLDNHVLVTEEEWTSPQVNLPKLSEMPGLDFELVNFHRPIFGTFHSKFMVVDRRVAILNSNNIQDIPNMEMMVHYEGPIVDSLYDTALLSWERQLIPPLPRLQAPASTESWEYKFAKDNEWIAMKDLNQVGEDAYDATATEQARETDQGVTSSTKIPKEVEEGSTPSDGPTQQTPSDVSMEDRLHPQHHIQPDGHKPLDPKVAGYQPFVLHSPHDEFPMAMVSRRPYGTPGHCDMNNPQDMAWLAGCKYAQKSVFVQTPDFNTKPIINATLDAVRRGIECILYICVGYNDAGEALPFQGGTNEEVVQRMYAELDDKDKPKLKVYWYTAKDQDRPINASLKQRNCHIKLMIVDDAVGIQGNGNQDTQSWYHSQEVNIMIDSELVCREWSAAIEKSQNTHLYGRVDDDGVWRDLEGKELPDSTGIRSGPMGLIKGIQGSIARVRGTGGF